MSSFRTVFVLFLFALITIVGSTTGQQGCDSSPTQADLSDEQSQRSMDSAEKMGRNGLECGTTGGVSGTGGSGTGGSSGNNGLQTITGLVVGLFFIIGIAIGLWFVFVRRPQALNAAVVKPYPGEGMGYGMDAKAKTVAMSGPAGKHSTNV